MLWHKWHPIDYKLSSFMSLHVNTVSLSLPLKLVLVKITLTVVLIRGISGGKCLVSVLEH